MGTTGHPKCPDTEKMFFTDFKVRSSTVYVHGYHDNMLYIISTNGTCIYTNTQCTIHTLQKYCYTSHQC